MCLCLYFSIFSFTISPKCLINKPTKTTKTCVRAMNNRRQTCRCYRKKAYVSVRVNTLTRNTVKPKSFHLLFVVHNCIVKHFYCNVKFSRIIFVSVDTLNNWIEKGKKRHFKICSVASKRLKDCIVKIKQHQNNTMTSPTKNNWMAGCRC